MKRVLYILATILFIYSCITPFEPEGIALGGNMIVIEGDIIANDTTRVAISKSLALDDNNVINYVSGAAVWVESETGKRFNGSEKRQGGKIVYLVNTKGIDVSERYKLSVSIGNKKYESEFVDILISPEIDSIGYNIIPDSTEVVFYVNTFDPENSTRYYKWRYTEDWEYRSNHLSLHDYNPHTKSIFEIEMAQNRYYCWSSAASSAILIASTDHLAQDRVHQKKLLSVGNSSLRINYLYSMELTQMAISKRAFIYWDNVRKNSDDIGGLFAPQPSEMAGNIICVSNPGEKVIGYVSGAYVSKKRVYFYGREIGIYKDNKMCESQYVGIGNMLPIDSLYHAGYDVVSYFEESNESYWVMRQCVDCRIFGTKNKPSFWPTDHI